MTHDYKRNGTTTLFAALNVLDGQVIGQCQQRHTHAEWLKFLKKIDRETPKDKTLHLIADNYATHKHPTVQEWLVKHPRFVMHFTPTSASWLNMVERFFVTSPPSASVEAYSPASPNWWPLSTNMLLTTTPNRNPLSGPKALVTSCRRSFALIAV
jgi:hypothetical protein